MKVVKTIDAQEKSMQKVFDALTKHLQKYPDDFATLYVGQQKERENKELGIDHSMFIFQYNEQHFLKSHTWHFVNLMTHTELDVFNDLHNHALELYNKIHDL